MQILTEAKFIIKLFHLLGGRGASEESDIFLDCVFEEEMFLWEVGHFSSHVDLAADSLQITHHHLQKRCASRVFLTDYGQSFPRLDKNTPFAQLYVEVRTGMRIGCDCALMDENLTN